MRAGAGARRVERERRLLLRRGMPRVEMSLILAATGAAGFLASYLMLRLGLSAMWLRYALAVLLAYAVFLLLLRLWLFLYSREQFGDPPDLGLDLLPSDFVGEAGARAGGGASSFGGGGDFGGGGAGGSWGGAAPCPPGGGGA